MNRPNVLVTGASSGIGLAICHTLLKEGYEVYGIGRNFSSLPDSSHFHPIILDLTDTQALTDTILSLKKEVTFSILVNNAGVGYYGPHEELSASSIAEMVQVNLTAPLLLTNLLLRDLKQEQGHIIAISSVTATKHNNTHGCAYGATKAGVSSFHKSLFEEVRKYGLRVTVIQPDMAKTNLYRNASFQECAAEDTHLTPEEIADAVLFALHARKGMNFSELTLQPQRNQIQRKPSKNI